MKKFLSLVLALVMTMSLVTISAGAAEYADASDINYEEAVGVISGLDIVGGSGGSFYPNSTLSRGAAAKIICNLVLGVEVANALPKDVTPFSDVPANSTFSAYVAYCASEGIIGGYGDGTFRPSNPVSGNAFLKMLLCALGYDAKVEGFNSGNMAVKVALLAKQRGLLKGLEGSFVGTKNATREEACLYAFNALMADDVGYATSQSIQIGDLVINNNSVADTDLGAAGTDPFYTVSFVKLDSDPDTDALGRPATKWYLNKDKTNATSGTYNSTADTLIGSYGNVADYTFVLEDDYTGKASLLDVVKALLDDSDAAMIASPDLALNGDTSASRTACKNAATYGATVELWADDDGKIEDVVVYNYALVEVTDVDTYEKGDAWFDDYGITEAYELKTYTDSASKTTMTYGYVDTLTEDKTNTQALGDLDKGDIFVAVVASNDKILATEAVETVSGTVTAVGSDYAKIDGAKLYNVGGAAVLADEGTFYLDPNGMIIAKNVEAAATTIDDALYVVDSWQTTETKYGVSTVTTYAQVVDLEGTVQELVIGTKKGNEAQKGVASLSGDYAAGKLVKATWDKTDKVYTLAAWAATNYSTDYSTIAYNATPSLNVALKNSTTKVGSLRLTEDTVYVVVEASKGDIKVSVVEGGVNYTMASGDKSAVITKTVTGNSVAQYVVLGVADYTASVSEDVLYVNSAAAYETVKVDGTTCYKYEVYDMTGKVVEIVAADDPSAYAGFKTYSVDENDVYTLEAATSVTINGTAYDDEVGYTSGNFSSYYGTLLTLDTSKVSDVETKNAKIIDLHDQDASGAYAKTVNSLEAMKKAADAGWTVSVAMYLDNGATVIFVTGVTGV